MRRQFEYILRLLLLVMVEVANMATPRRAAFSPNARHTGFIVILYTHFFSPSFQKSRKIANYINGYCLLPGS